MDVMLFWICLLISKCRREGLIIKISRTLSDQLASTPTFTAKLTTPVQMLTPSFSKQLRDWMIWCQIKDWKSLFLIYLEFQELLLLLYYTSASSRKLSIGRVYINPHNSSDNLLTVLFQMNRESIKSLKTI